LTPETANVPLAARTMSPVLAKGSPIRHNEAPVEAIELLVALDEATETANVQPVLHDEATGGTFEAPAPATVASVCANAESAPRLGSTATPTLRHATDPASHQGRPEESARVSVYSRTVTRTYATRSAHRTSRR
jgi:hypothetical protein